MRQPILHEEFSQWFNYCIEKNRYLPVLPIWPICKHANGVMVIVSG